MNSPILYNSDETAFTSNGIGRLTDCKKCQVAEALNGEYELTLDYAKGGNHEADIQVDRIVVAKVSDGSMQQFRVYQTVRDNKATVSVKAKHISFDLSSRTFASGVDGSYLTPTQLFRAMQVHRGSIYVPIVVPYIDEYTFQSDITSTIPSSDISTFIKRNNTVRQVLASTSDNSFLTYWGGEFEWDNKTIKFMSHRGQDRNVTIRYGKNLVNLKVTMRGTTYNAIMPYWTNGSRKNLSGLTWAGIIYHGNSTDDIYAVVPVDMTDIPLNKYPGYIVQMVQAWFDEQQPWLPIDQLDVSFAFEDDNTKALSKILLGDTVKVFDETLGVDGTLRAVKTVWNVLDQRYVSINFAKSAVDLTKDYATFKKATQKKMRELDNAVDEAQTSADNAATAASNAATAASNAATAASNAATAANNAQTSTDNLADGTLSNTGGFIDKKSINSATSISFSGSNNKLEYTNGALKFGGRTIAFES